MVNNFKENKKIIINILIRYPVLVSFSLFFLSSFFLNFMINILTNLSYYFLLLFTQVQNNGLVIFDGKLSGELLISTTNIFYISPECISVSSYILIFLIFLSMKIDFKILRKILFKAFLVFTFFNLIRIFFLMFITIKYGTYYFDKYHLIFYQGLSGIVTALIIIYYLRKEKIKKIYPLISDIKNLIKSFKK